MNALLLIIFIIHLLVSLRLFLKKKRTEYALLIIVFTCLILITLMKLTAVHTAVNGIAVIDMLRYIAILLSVISIALMIRSRYGSNRTEK
ncbi:MAG: hypothetical protein CSA22_03620 [Deltaproteobacteria bacterium]|nr:MAG: hypothetical protein CSA22_03620 [Deltaproteobacteria bacterium]